MTIFSHVLTRGANEPWVATQDGERVNELESSIIPLLEKEGWMRDQENVAKQP